MNKEFEARIDQLQMYKYNNIAAMIITTLVVSSPEEAVNYDKYIYEFTPVSCIADSQINSTIANNLMKLYRVLEDTSVSMLNQDTMFCYGNGLIIDLDFKAKLIRLSKGRTRCSVSMCKLFTYKELYDALVLMSSKN